MYNNNNNDNHCRMYRPRTLLLCIFFFSSQRIILYYTGTNIFFLRNSDNPIYPLFAAYDILLVILYSRFYVKRIIITILYRDMVFCSLLYYIPTYTYADSNFDVSIYEYTIRKPYAKSRDYDRFNCSAHVLCKNIL